MLQVANSSVVAGVEYDTTSQVLTVKFVSGETYVYRYVGAHHVTRMMFSDSIGRYFQQNIRDNFDSERVEP